MPQQERARCSRSSALPPGVRWAGDLLEEASRLVGAASRACQSALQALGGVVGGEQHRRLLRGGDAVGVSVVRVLQNHGGVRKRSRWERGTWRSQRETLVNSGHLRSCTGLGGITLSLLAFLVVSKH